MATRDKAVIRGVTGVPATIARVVAVLGIASGSAVGCSSASNDTGLPSPQIDAGTDSGGGFSPDTGSTPLCAPGVTTSISGTVLTPAKSNPDPLYNAIVYVPKDPIKKFKPGVACDRCDAFEGARVVTSALTGPDGRFVLKGVPAGKDVKLVVQLGRWRRQVTLPEVKACVDNPVAGEFSRLPRNQSEGDIPQIAVVTGSADPLECVLRKIGVEDTEFTDFKHKGRIHMFKADGGADLEGGGISASSIWNKIDVLTDYDMVLLPCEGRATTENKSDVALKAMADYAEAGGRIFATHYSYVWIKSSKNPEWQNAASWKPGTMVGDALTGFIDTSFPKGKAMADWLMNVKASKSLGVIDIQDPRIDVASSKSPAQTWITSKSPASAQHFTFNVPISAKPEKQCGRVIFSNFHVVSGGDMGLKFFPNECTDGPLTPQEKVLEFMLFDLASCVQKDDDTPKIPR